MYSTHSHNLLIFISCQHVSRPVLVLWLNNWKAKWIGISSSGIKLCRVHLISLRHENLEKNRSMRFWKTLKQPLNVIFKYLINCRFYSRRCDAEFFPSLSVVVSRLCVHPPNISDVSLKTTLWTSWWLWMRSLELINVRKLPPWGNMRVHPVVVDIFQLKTKAYDQHFNGPTALSSCISTNSQSADSLQTADNSGINISLKKKKTLKSTWFNA